MLNRIFAAVKDGFDTLAHPKKDPWNTSLNFSGPCPRNTSDTIYSGCQLSVSEDQNGKIGLQTVPLFIPLPFNGMSGISATSCQDRKNAVTILDGVSRGQAMAAMDKFFSASHISDSDRLSYREWRCEAAATIPPFVSTPAFEA